MALYYETGNGWVQTKLARKHTDLDGYLCCPGPSLAEVNTVTLQGKGRMIFAINTAYPKVKPDVWMGLDNIACYNQNILYEPFMKIFRGSYYDTMMFNDIPVRNFPNAFWASVKEPEAGKTMFNYRQHDSPFVWHKNTLAVMIHYMIWLGFKNIYLIGCDMGGDKDYWDDRTLTDFQRKYNRKLYTEQVNFIRKLAIEGEKHGVAFYSCTPGSPLNEFLTYIPLDTAIVRSETKTKIKEQPVVHALDSRVVNVVTVYQTGGDYNDEYVYRLRDSVKKYLPNSTFTCVTNAKLKDVNILPLEHNLSTPEVPQWCKLEIFKHFTKGKTLYLDLSVVVQGDLTPLLAYSGFKMVKDFVNPKYKSSCVMCWEGDYSYILKTFLGNRENLNKQYTVDWSKPWVSGLDQLYIETCIKGRTFEDGLIVSYKRASKEEIDKAIIVKYHGKPRPHEVNWNIYRPKMRWEVLADVINKEGLKNVFELGVGKSQTFEYLLKHCSDINIIGVDLWQKREKSTVIGSETYEDWDMEALYNKAKDIEERYCARALVWRISTTEAAKRVPDNSLDLVFVDADHTYEAVMRDIKNWLPKLRPGGYMFGHDIDWLSVQYGVLANFRKYNKADDNLWWIRM
jgi:hypothetical protein